MVKLPIDYSTVSEYIRRCTMIESEIHYKERKRIARNNNNKRMPKYIVTNINTGESFLECVSDIARRIGIFKPDTISNWAKKAKESKTYKKRWVNINKGIEYEILFTKFAETKVNTGFRLQKKK